MFPCSAWVNFFLNLSSVYNQLSKAQEASVHYNSVKAVSVVGKTTAQNNLKPSLGLLKLRSLLMKSLVPSSKEHTSERSQPPAS